MRDHHALARQRPATPTLSVQPKPGLIGHPDLHWFSFWQSQLFEPLFQFGAKCVAARLSIGYYGAATSGDGQGYELNVIAAAVVGGASLTGGRGSALGAVLGALVIQMISSGIVILGIDQNYSQIIIGSVVIAAVVLDKLNTWLASRRLS